MEGLWNRREAVSVLGHAKVWLQLDPNGICVVNFKGSHDGQHFSAR